MQKSTFKADIENLEDVIDFVDNNLPGGEISMEKRLFVELAVQEAFTNIAQYAYAPESGEVEIIIENTSEPVGVVITLIDMGTSFNPLEYSKAHGKKNKEGGLGIKFIKESMDALGYSYEDGKNILTMTKFLEEDES